MELPCALGWVSGRWSTGPTASCSIPSMALLIRLDAVYGPGRVPEATGTGTSCPVRLGSPTGDSRREVEPPGRRLRAASAAPARRDFIRPPRHSSWSLSFSAEIFSAAWRAPMSSNMERVAAMPDASLYVNRDGGNLTKIPRSSSRGAEDPRSYFYSLISYRL